MYEHISGLRTRTCGETLSQNRTECLHAPQATCQRGKVSTVSRICIGYCFFQLDKVVAVELNATVIHCLCCLCQITLMLSKHFQSIKAQYTKRQQESSIMDIKQN